MGNTMKMSIAASAILLVALAESVAAQKAPNDDVPFAPFAVPSRFSIGWPNGAMHEADIGIPIHMWSRTSKIRQLGENQPDFALRDCFRLTKAQTVHKASAPQPDIMGTGCTLTLVPHLVFRQAKGG